MDLTASFNMSLKMVPMKPAAVKFLSDLCMHTKCVWEMSGSAVGSGEGLLFIGES